MHGKLFEDGKEKGTISDFTITPGKITYQDVMGEKVVVGKSNATATFILLHSLSIIKIRLIQC